MNKQGRPRVNPDHKKKPTSLSLDQQDIDTIKSFCNEFGYSRSEGIRTLFRIAFKRIRTIQ